MFHKHQWEIRVQTYAEPRDGFSAHRCPTEIAREIAFGVTEVLVTCPCGAIRTMRMLGAATVISATVK